MKTAPIVPARVDFSDAAAPRSPEFGDTYHGQAGAFAQARHVFLDGNALPGRWQGRRRFVVLETGFGLGNNFLATWAAWRDDPQRCERLVFLSVEKHPLAREDLARAHASSPEPALARQLLQAWPSLTPNLHALDFEGGRVRLMLAFGDAREWLPELVASVDAFFLDGFAPAKNPDLWEAAVFKQAARLAAPGATAATWSVARGVRDGLAQAGFEVTRRPGQAGKWQVISAAFAPRHRAPVPPGRAAIAPLAKDVLIVGAGLAGAACARVLSREGLRCTVIEAGATAATQASGNPGASSMARCMRTMDCMRASTARRRSRRRASCAGSPAPCPGCNGACCAWSGGRRRSTTCARCSSTAACHPITSRPSMPPAPVLRPARRWINRHGSSPVAAPYRRPPW